MILAEGSTIVSGLVHPAYALAFSKAVNTFSLADPHQRRVQGDRNALWFFIIAVVSSLALGVQSHVFSSAASRLVAKLRTLSFKAILRQDGKPYYLSTP